MSQTRIEDELCLVMDIEQMIAEIMGTNLEQEASRVDTPLETDKIVLFADDQGSIRGYVQAVLENMGVQHKVFEDGQGIIDFLEQKENRGKVGLVLTDLEMPNVSGHTVIKAIKETMGLKIPVVVHSSMTVNDSQRQAKELGADYFVGKINTDQIVYAVNTFMIR